MNNTPIEIEISDDGRTITTSIFQLLQWKHALRLEKVGLKMSGGRKVSTHLRKLLGVKRTYKIEDLQAWVEGTIEAVEAALKGEAA